MKKLSKLKLSNFAKFKEFECEFNNDITYLTGVNGSGKTTIGLTAIWAGIRGISERSTNGQLIGERFRFIGEKKNSADIEITILDEDTGEEVIIKNHITKDSNMITVNPVQDPQWLRDLLSEAFLSAKNFIALGSKGQALALGIDPSTFDVQIKLLKDEYTHYNREIRKMGSLEPIEETKSVKIADLIDERTELEEENRQIREKEKESDKMTHFLARLKEQRDSLIEQREKIQTQIDDTEARIKKGKEMIKDLPKKVEYIDLSDLDQKIKDAESINERARAYDDYIDKKETLDEFQAVLNENKKEQEKVQGNRLKYIQKFDLPFDGLDIDEEGNLLLDGRPIREPYFSRGELEIIVAKLYASKNPDLKTRFIDDIESLDEENRIKLIDDLLAQGFQVIAAEARAEPREEGKTIILKECKIDSGDTKEKLI